MLSRMKIRFHRPCYSPTHAMLPLVIVRPPLRLWMFLAVLALPVFAALVEYCEVVERSGTAGAVLAAVLLPGCIIGYLVMLVMLKKRTI